jgi:hypothetical protein
MCYQPHVHHDKGFPCIDPKFKQLQEKNALFIRYSCGLVPEN